MKTKILLPLLILFCVWIIISCNQNNNPVSSIGGYIPNIIFTASNHLCMIGSDGNNLKILGSYPTGSFIDWEAHTSLDGKKVVYSYGTNVGPQQIYVTDLQTLTTTNVTNDSISHSSPSFSPDGKSVIYLTQVGIYETLFKKNLLLSKQSQLTSGIYCVAPSYSNDGQHILFIMGNNNTDSLGITIMNSDGSNVILIKPNGWDPQFSPDGKKVLYILYGANAIGLYTMDLDGSNAQFISNIPFETTAKFSPDGSKIVVSNYVGVLSDIFIMNSDGTNPINLTNTPKAAEVLPSFSLDGTKIVYILADSTQFEKLMIMDINGNNKKILVDTLSQLAQPMFCY